MGQGGPAGIWPGESLLQDSPSRAGSLSRLLSCPSLGPVLPGRRWHFHSRLWFGEGQMGPRQVFKEAMFPPSLPQQQAANSRPSSGVITCLPWCWPVMGSAGVPRAWPQAAPPGEPSTARVRRWGAPSGGVRAAPRKKPKFMGAQGMQGELS